MKNKFTILVISALLVVLGFYGYNSFQERSSLEMDTVSYLEEQGYNRETDIMDLEVVNMGEMHAVVVNFRDEPMLDYFFGYKEGSDEIHQIDVVDKENKES